MKFIPRIFLIFCAGFLILPGCLSSHQTIFNRPRTLESTSRNNAIAAKAALAIPTASPKGKSLPEANGIDVPIVEPE